MPQQSNHGVIRSIAAMLLPQGASTWSWCRQRARPGWRRRRSLELTELARATRLRDALNSSAKAMRAIGRRRTRNTLETLIQLQHGEFESFACEELQVG